MFLYVTTINKTTGQTRQELVNFAAATTFRNITATERDAKVMGAHKIYENMRKEKPHLSEEEQVKLENMRDGSIKFFQSVNSVLWVTDSKGESIQITLTDGYNRLSDRLLNFRPVQGFIEFPVYDTENQVNRELINVNIIHRIYQSIPPKEESLDDLLIGLVKEMGEDSIPDDVKELFNKHERQTERQKLANTVIRTSEGRTFSPLTMDEMAEMLADQEVLFKAA